ncbi:PP2C family protein-serine/threonine phosphatase [Luedemannella flava]
MGAATDVGRVRHNNEDSLVAEPPVFAVADGMGGRARGDEASRLAAEAFARLAGDDGPTTEAVLDAVTRANDAILAASRTAGSGNGMGTTLVGLVLVEETGGQRWCAVNIGDSRLYRWAGGQLEQLTVDHSEIQELVDAGIVGEAQRSVHPRRNVVTRALGTLPAPVADCWLLHPVPGERFVLCSDGLTGHLDDAEIGEFLAGEATPDGAANRLVAAAVEAGGRDNVTVVVVDVDGTAHVEVDPGASTNPRGADGVM